MSEKPIYVQLMDSIKKKIQDGQLQVGDRLVSEREMSEQYGINRMTVRNALKKLQEEGVIETKRGSGNYVAKVPYVEDVLKQCEIETYFKYIVSGENFKRTKPDPEIYEYTCKQIGVSKDEIWVVEDSEYGIEAAKNAGLKVMGLYNSKLYQDLTDANLIISSLKQIMEEDIW